MLAYGKTLLVAGLVAFVVAAGGCEGDNIVDGPCSGNGQCTDAGKNVCDLTPASGDPVCVQCTPGPTGDASACTGATPACGDDRMCRKCVAHGECGSDACMPDGACAAEADVIYLKKDATGTMCTKTDACGTWNNAMMALNAARKIVRVVGEITVTGEVNNKSFMVLGDASTTFKSNGDVTILKVVGNSQVDIYDSKFVDARKKGIEIDDLDASIKMTRCKITNAGEEGLNVKAGKAEVLESEIVGSMREGIGVDVDGDVKVVRSVIRANRGGGVLVAANGKANITASFIVKNSGNAGGISIPNPGAGSDVSFNTIVDNTDPGSGVADAGGIFCDSNTFTFRNNIIYRNTGGNGGMVQTAGTCNFTGSFIMAAPATDTMLAFRDATANDYHLTAASSPMVKDITAAGVTCAGLVDFDGDTRPAGAGCELGADEIKQ